MFGPSSIDGILWPLLTSAWASHHLSMMVAHSGTHTDLPGYCAPTFPLMPVGSTPYRSVQVSGFADCCLLTPIRRLISASCSSGQRFASGFLQIRSHPRHPCLQLTLPLAGRVEDFHLQVSAPCRAHNKKKPPVDGRLYLWWGQDLNLQPSGYEPDELPIAPPHDVCAINVRNKSSFANFYCICLPFISFPSGSMTKSFPSLPSTARIIPSETSSRMERSARFATIMTFLPIISSGV